MFFNGITSRGKHAVYVTDGTTAGTSVFALQTRPNAEPVELEPVGGRLFFGRFTGLRGDEWWVSNGKASNTSLVTTHAPSTRAYESALIGFNDAAYFASVDSSPENLGNIVGRGIFRSDGTPKGTGVVLDNWLSSRHPKSAATRDAVFFTNDDASQLAAIDADGKATIISPMAPSATLDARDTVAAPGLTYTFTVSYRHHDPAAEGTFETFDDTNLYVTGPNGYAAYAKFVDVDWGSSGPRAASYTMQPPGGSWNNLDKGTYWVWMRDHGVKDGAVYVPAGPLGSFLVRPVTSEPGSISGTVFKDSDADGFVDVGELKHEGFRIWVDLNNDGRFQPNEPNARSGADGRYVIAGIPAGQYHVRQTPVEGWEFSTPDRVIRVLPGVDVEAPFRRALRATQRLDQRRRLLRHERQWRAKPQGGVLKGFTVYLERNFDGKLSDNDPRVVTGPGRRLCVYGPQRGELSPASGRRRGGVEDDHRLGSPHHHRARRGGRRQLRQRPGRHGAGIRCDSPRTRRRRASEPCYEPGLGGRRVFSDANRNGLWDANEPSTFSDYSGSYLLKGLLAGTHRIVCAVPDAGWVSTTPAAAVGDTRGWGRGATVLHAGAKVAHRRLRLR
jgi:ELWxxDGT repeat protein